MGREIPVRLPMIGRRSPAGLLPSNRRGRMSIFSFSFLSVAFVLVMSVPVAAQELPARHLITSVGEGEIFPCQLTRSRDSLKDILERAGWDSDGYPDVNWDEEAAIVVSPRISYAEAEMEFKELSRRSDGIHILYGWKRRGHLGLTGRERFSAFAGSSVDSDFAGSSVDSDFAGSSVDSDNDILIVAIPRDIVEEVSYCTRQNPPWESR